MIEWFTKVFSQDGDIAKLLTMIISAIVAMLVVFLNQGMIKKRERRVFLSSKIEELYGVVNEFERIISSTQNDVARLNMLKDPNRAPPYRETMDELHLRQKEDEAKVLELNDKITSNIDDATNEIQKLFMLNHLYFPQFKINKTQVQTLRCLLDISNNQIKSEEVVNDAFRTLTVISYTTKTWCAKWSSGQNSFTVSLKGLT